ncbi:MAG: GNAT family N-acetyltransferase [Nannocystaceae bacterium]
MTADPRRELPNWHPAPFPTGTAIHGHFCRLEKLHRDHAPSLFAAHAHDLEGRNWAYLPYGPFTEADHANWIEKISHEADPLFYAVIDPATGAAIGQASLMSIVPAHGVIEVGHIHFSPLLQRTPASTEALVQLISWAMDNGYRRMEWKCDAANAASRRAAQRLGLSFEGVFRNHRVVKNRNRDTAWYAATIEDWPALEAAYATWLDPKNFDAQGQQRQSLSRLTRPLLHATG